MGKCTCLLSNMHVGTFISAAYSKYIPQLHEESNQSSLSNSRTGWFSYPLYKMDNILLELNGGSNRYSGKNIINYLSFLKLRTKLFLTVMPGPTKFISSFSIHQLFAFYLTFTSCAETHQHVGLSYSVHFSALLNQLKNICDFFYLERLFQIIITLEMSQLDKDNFLLIVIWPSVILKLSGLTALQVCPHGVSINGESGILSL